MRPNLNSEEIQVILDGLTNLEFEIEEILEDTRKILRETGEVPEIHKTFRDNFTYNNLNSMANRLKK